MNGVSDAQAAPEARVVRAEEADVDTLSQVIADAFFDLAPSRWLVTDPATRREIFPGYFRIFVERALAAGEAQTTVDRSAVALWLPIGAQLPAPDPGYDQRLAAATGPWTGRFRLFDAALERRHPAGAPHHHLAVIAVRPDRQGRGTGAALLRSHHAALDSAGLPAYLEASGLRSRRLYLSHGYCDHGQPICLTAGVLLYPMWRWPAARRDGCAQ